MTDWEAQARELAIWIQVMDTGVCQDPDCKECKFVVDKVAAALERAAAAQREKDAQEVEKQFKDYVWCKQVAAAIRSAP